MPQCLAQLIPPPERCRCNTRAGRAGVGDSVFAAEYAQRGLNQKTVRLVYGEDLVPAVPPAASGFRHVGRCWITPHGFVAELH